MIPRPFPATLREGKRDLGTAPGSRFFVLLALAALAGCTVSDRPDPADVPADVAGLDVSGAEAMLHASAASWNAADLDGFIDDYTTDPELAFVGSSGVVRGINEVRTRYETGYWATGAPADSLRFEDLDIRPLGDRHALALGRYVLFQPDRGEGETLTSTGWFSLILGFDEGRWRILHDHTSELEAG